MQDLSSIQVLTDQMGIVVKDLNSTNVEMKKQDENQRNNMASIEVKLQTLDLEVKSQKLISKLTTVSESCSDLSHQSNDSITLDILIDADGKYQGFPPISVRCELPDGITIIGEETQVAVTHCPENGCFEKKLTYNYPLEQILAIIQKSATCKQEVIVQCVSAALTVRKVMKFVISKNILEYFVMEIKIYEFISV